MACCCAVLRCAVLRCAALRCDVLRCAALCCAVLCCAVLCMLRVLRREVVRARDFFCVTRAQNVTVSGSACFCGARPQNLPTRPTPHTPHPTPTRAPAHKKTHQKRPQYAHVWGSSAKHRPQKVGKDHVLQDEDIVQIVKKI